MWPQIKAGTKNMKSKVFHHLKLKNSLSNAVCAKDAPWDHNYK